MAAPKHSPATRPVDRILEIEATELGGLDTRSIVLGAPELQAEPSAPSGGPPIIWQGTLGDGRSRSRYYVRLLADGGGYCSCPDFYFRGLLRRQSAFRCKHLSAPGQPWHI